MVMNLKDDFEALPAATDGVSSVSFSPVADLLATTAWDGTTRVYEVNSALKQAVPKASIAHDGPVLTAHWSCDGSKLASAGADKSIRIMDVATSQILPIPNAHDHPVRILRWITSLGPSASAAHFLATAGWDRRLKYWDLRSAGPIASVALPERAYAMDASFDQTPTPPTQPAMFGVNSSSVNVSKGLLVVACAERHICLVDLQHPGQLFKTMPSPLKWQTRSIACFPGAGGYAVGSIDGRISLQYADPKHEANNFSFKGHREGNNAYSVNAIAFHPVYGGTFATGGSDGLIYFWDKDSRQKLDYTPNLGNSVSSMAFNGSGSLFAYAVSYDWSKGHENYPANAKNAVMVRVVQEGEVKPRGPSPFRRR